MKISIERHTGEKREQTPYFIHLDTSDITIHKPSTFKIPVQVHYHGTNKRFEAFLCGFKLAVDKPDQLPGRVEALATQLINMARLPKHVFVARRAGFTYPVYTIGSEVMVTTPGGPIFQHVELAKVREYLTDYLHETHILGEKGKSDKLHVRGVNMQDLSLRRPVFYLKKRVTGEDDFWAPVFENGAGDGIYTYAVNARRDVLFENDIKAVLRMRDLVAELLLADNRLSDLYDLRPDRLMPDLWARLRENLTAVGQVEVNGQTFPLYNNGKTWIGVETRPDEERYGLFLGKNSNDVRGRMARDFIRRGIPLPA